MEQNPGGNIRGASGAQGGGAGAAEGGVAADEVTGSVTPAAGSAAAGVPVITTNECVFFQRLVMNVLGPYHKELQHERGWVDP
jgi:hypothetical protein